MSSTLTKSRVTLRDVASQLDVSHTTVSRALRDDPQISKAMREQVQKPSLRGNMAAQLSQN
jgi:IS30 family transposase